MAVSAPTMLPNSSLTLKNPNPPQGLSNTPAERFLLFSNEWLDIQNYVARALKLPINVGDFNKKYGSFSDQNMVKNVLDAMTKVKDLGTVFGDPGVVRDKIIHDGQYLMGDTPPNELYGHIVWLASKIENTAGTFSYTYQNLSNLLSPSAGTPDQRADNLKSILVGRGGLVAEADDMLAKTAVLRKALESFAGQMNDANTQILTYTGLQSDILKHANDIIGTLNADVHSLQDSADEAYKKWRDYTIAAVVTSVVIMAISFGLFWPVSVALGVGLGIEAGLQRKIYNELVDKIRDKQVEIQQKVSLVNDLKGLNTAITPMETTITKFLADLTTIEGVWSGVKDNLSFISTNYGVDQLSNLPFVTQTFRVLDATKKWKDISATAAQFIGSSSVVYDNSISFGDKIPE